MRLGDMSYHRYRTDKHAISITENFSATISNESQDIEAAVDDDLKQAQQLMNADNTTGAIKKSKMLSPGCALVRDVGSLGAFRL